MKAKMNLWARRALAFVLSFVMAIGGVPAQAFADPAPSANDQDVLWFVSLAINGEPMHEWYDYELPSQFELEESRGYIEPYLDNYAEWDTYDDVKNLDIKTLDDKQGSSNIIFHKDGSRAYWTVSDPDAITETVASTQVNYTATLEDEEEIEYTKDYIITVGISITRCTVINNATLDPDPVEDLTYNGNKQEPEFDLLAGDDGETVIDDKNYTVTYTTADSTAKVDPENEGSYRAWVEPKPLDEQTYQEGVGKLVNAIDNWYNYYYNTWWGDGDPDDYFVDCDPIPFKINKSTIGGNQISGTWTPNPATFEENGQPQAPTFNATGIADDEKLEDIVKFEYAEYHGTKPVDPSSLTWTEDKPSKAGTYLVKISLKDPEGNYVFEEGLEGTQNHEKEFVINEYDHELTTSIEGWTYDERDKEKNAPHAQLDGEELDPQSLPEGAVLVFWYKKQGADDSTYVKTVPKEAGDYTLRAAYKPYKNADILFATADFTIAKRTVKTSITIDPAAWFKDEEAPKPEVDAVYDEAKPDTKAYYRKVGDTNWIEWAKTAPTEPGEYEAVAICNPDDDYANFTVETGEPVTFEIVDRNKFAVTMDDWTYGDQAKDPVALYGTEDVSGKEGISFEYKEKAEEDTAYTKDKPVNAGEYTVRATYFPLVSNGSPVGDSVTATDDFKISPKPYTVTAKAKVDPITYGQEPELDWDDGDTDIPDGFTPKPQAELEQKYTDEGGKVGTYAILFKDVTFEKDEEGNYKPATVVYGNEQITYVPGTLTVNPKEEITVTAEDKTITYGDEVTDLTATVEPEDAEAQPKGTPVVAEAEEKPILDAGAYDITFKDVVLDTDEEGNPVATTVDEDGVLVTYVPGTLTVSPKHVVVVPDNDEKTYGEADPDEFTYKVLDAKNREEVTLPKDDKLVFDVYRDKGEDAGEYAIYVLDQDNYDVWLQPGHDGGAYNNYVVDNFEVGKFTINRRNVTVTPKPASKTVGEKDPEFTATVEGTTKGETVTYTITREDAGTDDGEKAGEHTIKASGEAIQGNYNVTYEEGTLIIEDEQKVVVVAAEDAEKTYGEEDPAFKSEPENEFTMVRSDKEAEDGEDAGVHEDVITFDVEGAVDMGGYLKYVDEETSTTYYLLPGTLTINPKKVVVKGITAEDKVYDRTRDVNLNVDAAEISNAMSLDNVDEPGLIDGDEGKVIVSAEGAFEDARAGKDKTVRILSIKLVGEKADNYVIDWEETQTETTANIFPRPVRVEIDSATKAYGDEDPDFTATVQRAEGDEGQIAGDEIKYNLTRTAGEDVGTYSIKNTLNTDQGNYVLTVERGTLTIEAKKVIVRGITAKDKDYDGTDVAELVFDDAEVVSPVGRDKLTVTAKGTFASKDVRYKDDKIAQKRVDITDIALEGDKAYNYEVVASTDDGETQTEARAKILPIPVKVSGIEADDKSYDGTTDATLDCSGATFETLIGEDEVTVESATGEFEDKNVSKDESGAVADKTVNVSEITLGGKDGGNYYADPKEGTQATATAKINPISVTVTGLKGVSKDYDGTNAAEIDFSAAVVNGLIDADAGKVAVTAATGHFQDANAGSKKSVVVDSVTLAKAEGADEDVSGNYVVDFPEIHAEEADINRLKVTVTADDKKMTYGDAEPELTWTAEPALIEGDTIQATPVREAGNDAGTYEISFANGQAEQGNYEVTFQNGTFTIESREVTVTADDKSMTYGDAEPELTWTASREPEPAIVDGDQLEVGITREPGKDFGTYEIFFEGAEYQGGKNGINYHVTYVGGTFSIARRNVTVTGNSQSKVYGNKDPKLTATVKGTVNGETVSYEIMREAGEDAHTYPVFVTGKATQGNYNVTFKNGKFTITRRKVTVKANDLAKYYKAKDPKLTATVTGVDKGETVTYKLKRAKGEAVGTYAIKASGKAVQGNYEVTFQNGSLTIRDKAKLVPEYSAHMMSFGWSPATYDGDFAGTTGQKRRMEALTLKIPGAPYAGGIRYRANVQSKGWMGWKKDGALAGTWGKSLQAEAFQIKLYGELAKHYDVYYRVHVKTKGWMAWAKNGKTAGTIGQNRRCEAIQVIVLRKGSKAPSPNYKGVAQMYNRASE